MAFTRIETTMRKTHSGRVATRPGAAGAYAFFVLSVGFAAALVFGLIA